MTDRQALRATIDKAKRFNYQKVVMRITLTEELLNELETLSKSEWKLAGELTEAQMKIAGLEKVHELFLRAKALMYQSGGTPIENSLNPIDAWLYDAERAAAAGKGG